MGHGNKIEGAPINALSACLARIEVGLVAVSGLAMLAIMLIVVLDVAMRYVFAAPFSWSYSLIGLYLVGAVFFLALPDTLQHHGHIALDVFVPLFPDWLRHTAQSLGYAASCGFAAVVAWLGWVQAHDAFVAGDRLAAIVPWPTWIAYAILAVGMAVLTLRCAFRAVFHAASVVAGRALVELPPPPETSQNRAERDQ
jgi:TRAP-type C4-dicarboxylate transport system permease small subunit